MSIHEKCIFDFQLKNCPFLSRKQAKIAHRSDKTEGLAFPLLFGVELFTKAKIQTKI